MIRVKLLGGAKKALGSDRFEIESDAIQVSEILDILRAKSINARLLLKRENLIIAINGVDCIAIGGDSTTVKSHDEVTIATVVHGGASKNTSAQYAIRKFGGKFVLVAGIAAISNATIPAHLLNRFRSETSAVIQAINADSIFGMGHIFGVIHIALEAEKQQSSVASKLETEILVRLAATKQISQAIERTGFHGGRDLCVIAISDKEDVIMEFLKKVTKEFRLEASVFTRTTQKGRRILRSMGLRSSGAIKSENIELFLVERAAITMN